MALGDNDSDLDKAADQYPKVGSFSDLAPDNAKVSQKVQAIRRAMRDLRNELFHSLDLKEIDYRHVIRIEKKAVGEEARSASCGCGCS